MKSTKKEIKFTPLCLVSDAYLVATGYCFPEPLQALWMGRKPISAVGKN